MPVLLQPISQNHARSMRESGVPAREVQVPEELQRDPDRVQRWLEDAVRHGSFGEFDGGFPRRVWRRVGDTIFEARQGTPGSGIYHGYPLESFQSVEGLG